MILHILNKLGTFETSDRKFEYVDKHTTDNLMAIKEKRYEDLDRRSVISKVFESLQEKIDKLNESQKAILSNNVLDSNMYLTPAAEHIDEAKLFHTLNTKGVKLTIDETVRSAFGENGDYSKFNNLMKNIDSVQTGRTKFFHGNSYQRK